MSLRKIIGGLILLTAILDCTAQAQAVKVESKGEIWFEPAKMEGGGQANEGERGHLIVRENRKEPEQKQALLRKVGMSAK